jgi:hypothetical protein
MVNGHLQQLKFAPNISVGPLCCLLSLSLHAQCQQQLPKILFLMLQSTIVQNCIHTFYRSSLEHFTLSFIYQGTISLRKEGERVRVKWQIAIFRPAHLGAADFCEGFLVFSSRYGRQGALNTTGTFLRVTKKKMLVGVYVGHCCR